MTVFGIIAAITLPFVLFGIVTLVVKALAAKDHTDRSHD
jgi:hypothetical protein